MCGVLAKPGHFTGAVVKKIFSVVPDTGASPLKEMMQPLSDPPLDDMGVDAALSDPPPDDMEVDAALSDPPPDAMAVDATQPKR